MNVLDISDHDIMYACELANQWALQRARNSTGEKEMARDALAAHYTSLYPEALVDNIRNKTLANTRNKMLAAFEVTLPEEDRLALAGLPEGSRLPSRLHEKFADFFLDTAEKHVNLSDSRLHEKFGDVYIDKAENMLTPPGDPLSVFDEGVSPNFMEDAAYAADELAGDPYEDHLNELLRERRALYNILLDGGTVYRPSTGHIAVSWLHGEPRSFASDPAIFTGRLQPEELASIVQRGREADPEFASWEVLDKLSDTDAFLTLDDFMESDVGRSFLSSPSDDWYDITTQLLTDACLDNIKDKPAYNELGASTDPELAGEHGGIEGILHPDDRTEPPKDRYIHDGRGIPFDAKGHVVLARNGGDALLLRNSSSEPFVAASGYDFNTGTWAVGFCTSDLWHALERFDSETVCTVRWQRDDLLSAINDRGNVRLERGGETGAEVEWLVSEVESEVKRGLKDRSIEKGWEVIDALMPAEAIDEANEIYKRLNGRTVQHEETGNSLKDAAKEMQASVGQLGSTKPGKQEFIR